MPTFELPESAQEVFDTVLAHARTMGGVQCRSEAGCVYRGQLGSKCFAGVLIPDDVYNESKFERLTWDMLVEDQLVPERHASLIADLQQIHDSSFYENNNRILIRGVLWWEFLFGVAACKYNLTYTFPLLSLSHDEIEKLQLTCENMIKDRQFFSRDYIVQARTILEAIKNRTAK